MIARMKYIVIKALTVLESNNGLSVRICEYFIDVSSVIVVLRLAVAAEQRFVYPDYRVCDIFLLPNLCQ